MNSLNIHFLLSLFVVLELFQSNNALSLTRPDKTILEDEQYPIVNVTQGQLQGLKRTTSKGTTYYSFKGIPFAEPPIGDLRFRDPVPINSWTGVRNAFEEGSICAQFNVLLYEMRGDEDCLFLNVYTPNLPNEGLEKYPVVINIHGGGLTMGSGSEYDSPAAVFVENDLIVVSMNYRLDMFGFLTLDVPEVPGNAALKDQLLAIKWVNENIEYFNGDKDNVSLYGLSGGAGSVEYQLLNSKSEGLFHRADMQSGAAMTSWGRARNQEKNVQRLANAIGTNIDPYDILNRLSTMTTTDIIDITLVIKDEESSKSGYFLSSFGPAIENSFSDVEAFLTQDPLELYKAGDYVKVPVLETFCRDEGNSFPEFLEDTLISEIKNRQYADFIEFVNVTDKDSVNGNLTALYSAMNVSDDEQVNEFFSDIMFFGGINQALKYFVKDNTNDHYSYLFSFVGNQSVSISPDGDSVPHGIDAAYWWIFPESVLSEEELRMKQYLTNIHMSFFKYGIPSAPNTVWDPITEASFNVLNIDGTNNQMEPFPFADRMNYWDTLYV